MAGNDLRSVGKASLDASDEYHAGVVRRLPPTAIMAMITDPPSSRHPGRRFLALAVVTLLAGTLLAISPLPTIALVPRYGVDRAAVALEPTDDAPDGLRFPGEEVDEGVDEGVVTGQDEVAPPPDEPDRLAGRAEDVEDFLSIGLAVDGEPTEPPLLRVRSEGQWSDWMELQVEADEAPDDQSTEGGSALTTAPVWVDHADAYEINVPDEPATRDAEVLLVREQGTTVEVRDATPPAGSYDGRPPIYGRSSWGARPYNGTPEFGDVKLGVVHHSVTANGYSSGDVPGILRSIQAYHMDANGWHDIGYNFAVDRFGRAWEARAGGVSNEVIGGHAKGFNTWSTGVVILGDYTAVAPSSASLDTVGDLLGWKLGMHGVTPDTPTTVQSLGSTSIPAGQWVTLNTVSGHRDVGATGCPGNESYNRLWIIRNRARAKFNSLPGLSGSLDLVVGEPGNIRVAGWAIDPFHEAASASAHIYVDGQLRSGVVAGTYRPDVGAATGLGDHHGFDTKIPMASGTHSVCVYALGNKRPIVKWLGCRTVTLPDNPFGAVESIEMGFDEVRLRGYAIDPNTTAAVELHVYIDGRGVPGLMANQYRPDVGAAFPGYGNFHGFDLKVPTPSGSHQVCVFAINQGPGNHTLLRCEQVTTPSGSPFGSVDIVSGVPGGVRVAGWAVDWDTDNPLEMHVYIDGSGTPGIIADLPRPDVSAVYPLWGPNHGFDVVLPATTGVHTVCTFAINQGVGQHTLLRCQNVLVWS